MPGGGQTSLWDGEGIPGMGRGSSAPVTRSGKREVATEVPQALGLVSSALAVRRGIPVLALSREGLSCSGLH